jgi:hypothetical protein
MRDEIRDAIDAACSAGSVRVTAFDVMKTKLIEIARNLPEDMSVRELLEDIED